MGPRLQPGQHHHGTEGPARRAAEIPRAKAFDNDLNAQNRFAILHRLEKNVKPETRAKRLAQFIAMLERGERLHA